MSFSHITHHMGRVPQTQQHAVVRVTPIIRLSQYNESVYLQSGHFFDAEGKEVKDLPGWVYFEMAKLTPAALKSVGFDEPLKVPAGVEVKAPTFEAPATWTCPDCHKVMDERNKEPHIAKHNRHRGPNEQMKNAPSATAH